MAELPTSGASGKVVIKNIGLLLSGDIDQPILAADTIIINDGIIVAVGKAKDCDHSHAQTVIDAQQCCVSPGLIDSHVHPVFGDWTPRQNQLGWIESTMHGGVTTMISAGEVHLPGRPKDIVGLKALAITAQRAFDNFRPGGVKVIAGAPIIEKGMVEQDFKDLAEAGVTLLGEVGLGTVKAGYEAKEMVAWARKYGMQSTIHTVGRRFQALAISTKMWCWKPMPTSLATSMVATHHCRSSMFASCAKNPLAPLKLSTTAMKRSPLLRRKQPCSSNAHTA